MSAQIIAIFTLREALRRRVVLAAALLTFGYLVLYGVGVWFGYRDLQNNSGGPPGLTQAVVSLMLVGGLWSLNFIASMLAVFLSVGALSGEVDQGTLHAIAARPIRRSEIVLGQIRRLRVDAGGLHWRLCRRHDPDRGCHHRRGRRRQLVRSVPHGCWPRCS